MQAAPRRRPPVGRSTPLGAALAFSRVDFAPRHEQPSVLRLVVATLVSIGGSLLVDAALVVADTSVFPSTKGYGHFRLSDYGTLTVVGVLAACAAWPVATRVSSAPRWLFLCLAVPVTTVLWLPDLWLLAKGEPARAVVALIAMHLAVALVTYNALVRVARTGPPRTAPSRLQDHPGREMPGPGTRDRAR